MKKIITLFVIACIVIPSISFAQTAPSWKQMTDFHNYMAATFHPAEEGNFQPLRTKADSMYRAAKVWAASPIPVNFKEKETKEQLVNLQNQIVAIQLAVKNNAPDEELLPLISATHDTYHKITGECRKETH